MSKKKVLFIGGSGTISTSAMAELLKQNIQMASLSRSGQFNNQIKAYLGDRNDAARLAWVIADFKPDIVLDFACFEREQCRAIADLLENEVEQYVFVSTVDVYGFPLSRIPMAEGNEWNAPNCPYAEKKRQCEELLLTYRGLPSTIIRPAYSMGNSFMITALAHDGGRHLISRLKEGKKIFSPGDGRTLIHVSSGYNTGRMIARVVGDERAIGQSLTCGHAFAMEYDSYIELAANVMGVKAQLVHVPTDFVFKAFPAETGLLLHSLSRFNLCFSVDKFLNLYPDFVWEKSIEESIADFAQCQTLTSERTIEDDIIEEFERRILC